MHNSQKGFTLIELLIVFAIIGILVAVGATVVPGLLGGAKEKATVENHSQIASFLQIKSTQCSNGAENLTYTSSLRGETITIACTTNIQEHLQAIVNHLKYENFKNPFNTYEPAVIKSQSNTPGEGFTHLSCYDNSCNLFTNTGSSILHATVDWKQ